MRYKCFTRRWYKNDSTNPEKVIIGPGRKTHLAYASTIEEAKQICADYNKSHNPGKYSLKAEFESI